MNDLERDAILLELKRDSNEQKESLVEIKTVLKGYNGNEGLCKKVNNNSKAINKLWIMVAILGTSLGGSAYGIIRALMG